MPPDPKKIEQDLDKLRALDRDDLSKGDVGQIKKALDRANPRLIAVAANIAGKRKIEAMEDVLGKRFSALLEKPFKSDPGCLAKVAIIDALEILRYDEESLYLEGLRFKQPEPVWGGRVDTAGALRGKCGQALVRLRYPDAIFEIAELLMDPEAEARHSAVQTLDQMGSVESELLLRMKVKTGDDDQTVIADSLVALMDMNPERSLDFVAGLLESPDPDTAEDAAIALGQSKSKSAFERLRDHWSDTLDARKKDWLLIPIALTRENEAVDLLIELIETGSSQRSIAAVRALEIYKGDDKVRQMIEEAIEVNGNESVRKVYEKEFGES